MCAGTWIISLRGVSHHPLKKDELGEIRERELNDLMREHYLLLTKTLGHVYVPCHLSDTDSFSQSDRYINGAY